LESITIPDDIKSIANLTTFKSKLKTCFLISLSRIIFLKSKFHFFHFYFLQSCGYCVKGIQLLYMHYTNVYYYNYKDKQEVAPDKENVRAACPKDKMEIKFFSRHAIPYSSVSAAVFT